MGITEDANAAADYIEKHGWTQRTYLDEETGAVCMAGALGLGNLDNVCYFHAQKGEQPYREFLDVSNITVWNDKPERTKEEVVQVLRDVATKHMPDEMRRQPND